MTELSALVRRNCKLFVKDKSMLLPALISPLILLFLYIAFLGDVYRDSIYEATAEFSVSGEIVESIAGGWILSSLLAVSAVTVAFTANIVAVRDRVRGQADDIRVTPVNRTTVSVAYFLSAYLITVAVCMVGFVGGIVYLAVAGWSLSAADVFLTLADTLFIALFGTALSSVINRFVRSEGGIAAVQSIVSCAYGFLCGAYMPLSALADWLRSVFLFLPGSYGTVLLHRHLISGAIGRLAEDGVPAACIEELKEAFDCAPKFFGSAVPTYACYLVLLAACAVLLGAFVLLCALPRKK